MSRIEKLTQEQIARFPEFVERWTKIGLCTKLADRKVAEAAIVKSYQSAGLQPPCKIVWCGSPLSQGLTRVVILNKSVWDSLGASVRASVRASVQDSVGASVRASVRDSVRDSLGASVRASVRDSVWDSVWASVRASVRDSVWDSVGDSVRASVRDSVRDSVWDSVRASVQDSVGDSVRASVRDSVWDSVYGQHDVGWLSFYDYFKEVLGLKTQTAKLVGLQQLAQSAGWALPHAKICWVSERHQILQRDERGRLHSVTGPACAYPDGWAIYAVHGVRVPAFVIEHPQKISVSTIIKEQNAEVRRVMIERYHLDAEIKGAAAFVRDAGGKRLDHDEGFGTLWRRDVRGDEPIVMLEVINSTPEKDGTFKRYFLRVPPGVTKAQEAAAWTFNLPKDQYAPQIET